MIFNFEQFLNYEKEKEYFKNIELVLLNKNITPSIEKVFYALEGFDFNNLKVIIIGQDPYPAQGVADGLAFSSNDKKTPMSLRNMFLEIKNSYPETSFNSNSLENWKDQGILLLNTILTTEIGKVLAHKNIGWEIFSQNLLTEINLKHKNIIYLVLGKKASNFLKKVNLENQIIIETSHPSPLGFLKGFKGSRVFEKVNKLLEMQNKTKIDWSTK